MRKRSFDRAKPKGWVMGIIGALHERGPCRSQQEIPRGRRPWNSALQKTKDGHPATPNSGFDVHIHRLYEVLEMVSRELTAFDKPFHHALLCRPLLVIV